MWNFDSLSHFNAFENKTSNATIQNVWNDLNVGFSIRKMKDYLADDFV